MNKNLHKLESSQSPLSVVVETIAACHEAKALNPIALELNSQTDVADYFIVMSGRSDRHVQGIGNRIMYELGKLGVHPESIEGFETGHWILIDYGEVVIHIFFEPVRAQYDLENLWGRAGTIDVEKLYAA
ncbi:MAG: ribosome silencing factor [Deltaproteobacteria bacterium]|nr:ribosome silencing factor [Deltaproteobacteria bacterium]